MSLQSARVDEAITYTLLTYTEQRHLQHCEVCVQESAVSMAWIIALGGVQAISVISSLAGYCLRRVNVKVHADEQRLVWDNMQAGSEYAALTTPGRRHLSAAHGLGYNIVCN